MESNSQQGRHAPAARFRRDARVQLENIQKAMDDAVAVVRKKAAAYVRKAAGEKDMVAVADIEANLRVLEALAQGVVSKGVKAALKAIDSEVAR